MIVVVIPAYNEEKTVGDVVEKCRMQNPAPEQARYGAGAEWKIVVVDDGSFDKTAQVARQAGAVVLSHPINCGLGAALATGIEAALLMQNEEHNSPQPPLTPVVERSAFTTGQALRGGVAAQGPDVIVTLDADGQHDPAEIPKLIEPILKDEYDVVIGSRFLSAPVVIASGGSRAEGRSASGGQSRATIGSPRPTAGGARDDKKDIVPFSRRIANRLGNLITYFLFGIRVTDSQSGFRAFSAAAAKKIRIRTNTMEVSSEIIREIKMHNLRFKEVPITPIYTDYSLSKGQGFFKGVETLWKLVVLKFFR